MKRIIKENSPMWFENWKNNFQHTNGREPHYKSDFATNDPDGKTRRRDLRTALIKEQGASCIIKM